MKSNDELAHNAALMKRCNKTYDIIVKIYAVVCAFYAGVALFQIMLCVAQHPLLTFLDGILFKGALFFCGLMACYKHNSKFAFFAMIITVINIFLNGGVNALICVITVLLSIASISVNEQYHYLENQTGFPYFNERFEEQNLDTCQRGIKDEYQQNYERLIKNSSSDMADVDSAVRTDDLTKKEDNAPTGTMDDI